MVSYVYVKWLTVLFCSLSMVFAENSRIKLEDIERDTLTTEKQSRPQTRESTFPDLPPRQLYATPQQANPEQAVGPHQFAPDARQYMNLPPPQLQQPQYIAQQQQYDPQQQQYLPQQEQYVPQQQQYIPQQQEYIPEQQYQIQYVQDNNLYPQQQYVPQYQSQAQLPYVFLPNAPAQQSSKPGITYVQYVDPSAELLRNPKIQETLQNPKNRANSHNLVGLIQKYAHTNSLPVNYQPPAPQTYRQPQIVVSQPFYGVPQQQPAQTNAHPLYQRTNQVLSQQRYVVPAVTSLRLEKPVYESQQTQQSIANAVYQKKGPQSLLDSYVPSALQVKYYNQLEQQRANAVPQFGKFGSGIDGKTEYLKHFSAGSPPYEYELPKYEH